MTSWCLSTKREKNLDVRVVENTGNPYWRGRIGTVDLLAQTSSDKLRFILKIQFYKTTYLKAEVKCTKPSPSVRIPWKIWYILSSRLLAECHFADRHFADRHFADATIYRLVDPMMRAQMMTLCRSNVCRSSGFRRKGIEPLHCISRF